MSLIKERKWCGSRESSLTSFQNLCWVVRMGTDVGTIESLNIDGLPLMNVSVVVCLSSGMLVSSFALLMPILVD